ncbi:MAG: SusC/RagA family TonB-linked outer membrane protein, partial [Agriterribacter sp.]
MQRTLVSRAGMLCLFLLCRSLLFAQTKTLQGVVKDEKDNPVPNVSIVVRATSVGTTTDSHGNFSITAKQGDVLDISSVGFKNQSITVGKSAQISITLESDVSSLSDVVVIGYGTSRKKDLTGSVAVVNLNDAKKQPTSSLTNMLQGQVSGVSVIGSGQPGQSPVIRIRGVNSFGNNVPLYVVDGVPTQNIDDINPNDISSAQVLKDAGAASIYGSRASNGIIIITTKKGSGRVKVSYDGYYGTQVPPQGNVWNTLSTQEMGDLTWLAFNNAKITRPNDPFTPPVHAQYGNGATPVIPDYILPSGAKEGDPGTSPADYYLDPNYTDPSALSTFNQIVKANKTGTDWFHEIFKNAPMQSHNLQVANGNENGSYLFSVNYFNQQGILINTYLKRYTIRANTQFKLSDRVRIGENLSYSVSENPLTDILVEGQGIGMAMRLHPMVPVYDIMGNYAGSRGRDLGNARNPVAIQQRTANNRNVAGRLFGNVFGEADILPNLQFRTVFGGEWYSGYNHSFAYPQYENSENGSTNSFTESSYAGANWTWSNTVTYEPELGDAHNIKLLAGTEAYKNVNRGLTSTSFSYISFDPSYVNLTNGAGTKTNGSERFANALFSYFGRVDYTFKSKYLLSATIRRDGSSKFIGNNRWGTFPAVSVGWRTSQEKFMSSVHWLSDLKIRGSWGIMGNQLNALDANSYTLYRGTRNTSYYDITGSGNVAEGLWLYQRGNQDGRWEKNINFNIGFDASILGGKIDLSADYYRKNIEDLLFTITLPGTFGAANVPAYNVAAMTNSGIDLYAAAHLNAGGKLKIDLEGTFTTYRNKITQIDANGTPYFDLDGRRFNGATIIRNAVGQPVSSFYGYQVEGFWSSWEEIDAANKAAVNTGKATQYMRDMAPGRFKYADIDGNGYINANDRTFLGNPNPKFSYGLNIGLKYKNFDFSTFIFGVAGNKIWNNVKWWRDFAGTFPGTAKSKTALYD